MGNILKKLGNRNVVIARELTKKFETIIRGTAQEIIASNEELKGECVIIVEGGNPSDKYQDLTLVEHVDMYIKMGNEENEAMKKAAKDLEITKSEVYKEYKIRR